jgi:hypothetical protein
VAIDESGDAIVMGYFCRLQPLRKSEKVEDDIELSLFSLKMLHIALWSAWLLAGRPRGQSSSPGWVKNFLTSRPVQGATQPPIQLIPAVKRPGREADHSPQTNAEVKKMWICTCIPIRHHGLVLNELSTGTTLPVLQVVVCLSTGP